MDGPEGNGALPGGEGDDWMNGGAGSDWIRVAHATGAAIDLGSWWGSQDTGQGAGSIRNAEHALGNSGADDLWGGTGANQLKGQGGGDWLDRREGEDQLTGGLGRDTMSAGDDRDRDAIIFDATSESAAGGARDVVQRFVGGIDADPALAGDQAPGWGGTTAGADRAWIATSGSSVILKADVTGDGVADFEVKVQGLTSLSSSDLLL